jgi:hypothetical protein
MQNDAADRYIHGAAPGRTVTMGAGGAIRFLLRWGGF